MNDKVKVEDGIKYQDSSKASKEKALKEKEIIEILMSVEPKTLAKVLGVEYPTGNKEASFLGSIASIFS